MGAVVKFQKRSLLSNATFNMNLALGCQKEIDHLFDPAFFSLKASRNTEPKTYSVVINLLFHQWPVLAIIPIHTIFGLQKLFAVGGWGKYGLTGQIKYPLTTNDSFTG